MWKCRSQVRPHSGQPGSSRDVLDCNAHPCAASSCRCAALRSWPSNLPCARLARDPAALPRQRPSHGAPRRWTPAPAEALHPVDSWLRQHRASRRRVAARPYPADASRAAAAACHRATPHVISLPRARRWSPSRGGPSIGYNASPDARPTGVACPVQRGRTTRAKVAELVDALGLEPSGETRESSSLSFRTSSPAASPGMVARFGWSRSRGLI
jgi:hypothetical protein